MTKPSNLYQVLGYAGLLPFLIGTYFTWCGPMQEIIYAAELFAVYSVAVLCFMLGSRWNYSLLLSKDSRNKLLAASCVYALVVAVAWLSGYLPATLLLLGLGYVALWLHGFFIPVAEGQGNYRTMRTVIALTVFVCHLLVAMQIYNL